MVPNNEPGHRPNTWGSTNHYVFPKSASRCLCWSLSVIMVDQHFGDVSPLVTCVMIASVMLASMLSSVGHGRKPGSANVARGCCESCCCCWAWIIKRWFLWRSGILFDTTTSCIWFNRFRAPTSTIGVAGSHHRAMVPEIAGPDRPQQP